MDLVILIVKKSKRYFTHNFLNLYRTKYIIIKEDYESFSNEEKYMIDSVSSTPLEEFVDKYKNPKAIYRIRKFKGGKSIHKQII